MNDPDIGLQQGRLVFPDDHASPSSRAIIDSDPLTQKTMTAKRPKRSYPNATVAVLWGKSSGWCAFPNCGTRCIDEPVGNGLAIPFGERAHIIAFSDHGPRADPALSSADRNVAENLILLCPTHHQIIDARPEAFSVSMLSRWKRELEERVLRGTTEHIGKLGFHELQIVCDAIRRGWTGDESTSGDDFRLVPIGDKIARNQLGQEATFLLRQGITQSATVRSYLQQMEGLDPNFALRLKVVFVGEYRRLLLERLDPDQIFRGLQQHATGWSTNLAVQSAGVVVLAYMFESCEVFEK